ncbi:MAG: prepilin-type N-terminal cleavage/methylation domain-containing protein [Planctomycetales bacterium]|nr:prepilin-type N-terminal cleavage/methylation domain-containing protein [Planctomycetales bacterium]
MILGRRRAFTLLELLLVLAIIVGVMAIAWPALSRSLSGTDLRQAGQTVRETLGDARRLAMETGEPVLVRVEPDGHTLRYEVWHRAMDQRDTTSFQSPFPESGSLTESATSDSGLEADSAVDSRDEAIEIQPPTAETGGVSDGERVIARRGETVTLSETVFVVSVELGAVANAASTADDAVAVLETESASTVRESPLGTAPLAFDDSDDDVTGDLGDDIDSNDASPGSLPNGLPQGAWLWFLPHGQGPAARIRLVDQVSRRELELTLDPWTGMLELGRDRPIDPELFDAAESTTNAGG